MHMSIHMNLKTKLYGLQLKKPENYVDFDVHACIHMNLKPSCMVCSSRKLKIMFALMCMGTHMNLKPSCMVCKSKDLINKLVLVCISTHMNFKPSCMVYNSRNLFELETMLGMSITILGGPRRPLLVVWL